MSCLGSAKLASFKCYLERACHFCDTYVQIEVMQKTGYGRFVIEKRIEKLVGAGTIRLIDDPGDRRKQLISRQDVQAIIDSLTI